MSSGIGRLALQRVHFDGMSFDELCPHMRKLGHSGSLSNFYKYIPISEGEVFQLNIGVGLDDIIKKRRLLDYNELQTVLSLFRKSFCFRALLMVDNFFFLNLVF